MATAHMICEPFHLKLAARALMRELDRGTLDDIPTDREKVAALAGFLDAIRLGEFDDVQIRLGSDGVPMYPGMEGHTSPTGIEAATWWDPDKAAAEAA
jgi:hypothetical protein